MIQILEAIEYLDSRRIPINPTSKKVLVEVASNRRVDMAIVTTPQFKEFQNADDDQDLSFEWVEGLRAHDFYVDVSAGMPLSLLVWNSNEDEDAVVAYKMTDLSSLQAQDAAVTSSLRA